uniref:RING-type domain-containing protein n=1 Tax=Chromera velia CCMP2878 TaxID=1169474 RepID=A0A0G4I5Y2_9ALVE|eukprot:Cvel_77.t1-p1 / transcript=Cvel_77.t1 / gene=Cvel_77 / organism=Chromera_velia_CCMP2878 / gene_product=hypothetical protein / transcript_product=hypothetical protein / location=Cvel_scaffold6:222283-223614(+) / protein_length=444 / sequence_SO=supercontig / SO=protein_coding / is_pseudo=false
MHSLYFLQPFRAPQHPHSGICFYPGDVLFQRRVTRYVIRLTRIERTWFVPSRGPPPSDQPASPAQRPLPPPSAEPSPTTTANEAVPRTPPPDRLSSTASLPQAAPSQGVSSERAPPTPPTEPENTDQVNTPSPFPHQTDYSRTIARETDHHSPPHTHRSITDETGNPVSSQTVPPFPVTPNQTEEGETPDDCVICLEPMETPSSSSSCWSCSKTKETCRLSCGHRFHEDCLIQSLIRVSSLFNPQAHTRCKCPICRQPIREAWIVAASGAWFQKETPPTDIYPDLRTIISDAQMVGLMDEHEPALPRQDPSLFFPREALEEETRVEGRQVVTRWLRIIGFNELGMPKYMRRDAWDGPPIGEPWSVTKWRNFRLDMCRWYIRFYGGVIFWRYLIRKDWKAAVGTEGREGMTLWQRLKYWFSRMPQSSVLLAHMFPCWFGRFQIDR